MYFWKDTIILIGKAFGVRQVTIAEKLNISTGTLSKIKTGKQPSTISTQQIYDRIFAPENEESLLKEKPPSFLCDIKSLITEHFPHMKEDLSDCWEDTDYKAFILCLLNRTKSSYYVESPVPASNIKKHSKINTNAASVTKKASVAAADKNQPVSSIAISLVSDETDSACVERCGNFDVQISRKDRICATCINWEGNVHEANCAPNGVYGICKMYKRDQISLEGDNCKHYTPNMSSLSQRKLLSQQT